MKSTQLTKKQLEIFNKSFFPQLRFIFRADVNQQVGSVSLHISIRTRRENNGEFSSRRFSLTHYVYMYFFIFFRYLNGEYQSHFFRLVCSTFYLGILYVTTYWR